MFYRTDSRVVFSGGSLIKKIMIVLSVLVLVAFGIMFWLANDPEFSCLDNMGCWDQTNQRCEEEVSSADKKCGEINGIKPRKLPKVGDELDSGLDHE